MDLTKAQRLLNKIQAFLDNGNAQDISRLEKDLIKSYILQLYDIVTEESEAKGEEEKPVQFVEYKMPKREPAPKMETPPVKEYEAPKMDSWKPEISEPVYKPQEEKPAEKETIFQPVHKTPEVKPVHHHEPEPVVNVVPPARIHTPSPESNEKLAKLFDIHKTDEMSGRFSHVPIPSIESAMGLNERIFTLNELFAGNKSLFDSTCAKLNSFNSFDEAKSMLISGVAKENNWSSPERTKMAEQFIRIVSRRYPKPVS